jgi:Mrp family chromosome partitioning ATPase/uncharacterized protein involved in exopolysaccharide biosynthesis
VDRSWARAADGGTSQAAPTLGDLAKAVGRRKLIVAAGAGVGLLLGALVLPTVLPDNGSYQATVRLKVAQLVSDTIVRERPQFELEKVEGKGNALQDVVLADEVLGKLGGRATGLSAQDVVSHLTVSPVVGSSFVDLGYVDSVKARADRVVAAYAKTWAARRNALDAQRLETATTNLDRQVKELRERLSAIPSTAAPSTEASNTRARVDALLTLRNQVEKQRLFLGPPTAVLGTPIVTELSAPTARSLLLALGLLIGLFAGVGLALLSEAMHPKLLAPGDVEHATGLPVIAGVPPTGMRGGLPVVDRPFSPAAEGFRRLGGALERRGLGDEVRILAIASADRREGRSLLAINLAHLLARQGRDVLLVSADLRHPALDELLGVADEPGFAEWLESGGPDHELPLRLVAEHLLILPAGSTEHSPGELLTARRVRVALHHLANTGFIVLIDTPPVLASAEATTIAAVADATLLVARAGASRWRAIEHVAEVFRRDGVRQIGTVLLGDRGRPSSLLHTSLGFGYAGRHSAGGRRRGGGGTPPPFIPPVPAGGGSDEQGFQAPSTTLTRRDR